MIGRKLIGYRLALVAATLTPVVVGGEGKE